MTSSQWLRPFAAALLTLGVARSGCAQAAPLNTRDMTVAGITIGMDSGTVRRVLGNPDSIAEGSDPSLAAPIVAWYYRSLQVLYSEASVHGIWLADRRVATARGLRVGDSVAVARRLYGKPTGGSTIPPGLDWSAKVKGARTMLYVTTADSTIIKSLYVGHNID